MGIDNPVTLSDGGLNNELLVGDDDYFENLVLPDDWLGFGFNQDWDAGQFALDADYLQSTPKIMEFPEVKELQNCVQEYSGSHADQVAGIQESSCVFQPTSPVSELESSGSCSGAKSLPIKSNVCPPGKCRSKLLRPSGVDRWRAAAPDFAAAAAARRTSNSGKHKKRCKKMPQPVARVSVKDSFDDAENPEAVKKCTHCQITKTPQWREGPNGPKTLCNACGVRYRSGRLYPEYRPAASPTFVPSLHSNSHKKVVELRNKTKPQMTILGEPPIKPPTQPHMTILEEPSIMLPPPQPELLLPVSSYPVFESVPVSFSEELPRFSF